jgi:hypothetical protein
MGWYEEPKKTLGAAAGQLSGSAKISPYRRIDTKSLRFTNNFYQKAKVRGLREKDALDVYYHGQVIKQNMMVRKYNGYEIAIYYFVAPDTGQTIITSIWKKLRR